MRKFLWLLLAIIACSCKTTGMLTGQYYADNSNATFNLQKDSSFTFHWSGGCVMKDEATGYYTFKNNVVTFYYGPAKIDTTITHYNKVNYHLQPAVASEAHGAAVVHNTILANALLIADTVPVIDTGYTQSDLHNYKATRPLKLYYFKKQLWYVTNFDEPVLKSVKVDYRLFGKSNLFKKRYVYTNNAYTKSKIRYHVARNHTARR